MKHFILFPILFTGLGCENMSEKGYKYQDNNKYFAIISTYLQMCAMTKKGFARNSKYAKKFQVYVWQCKWHRSGTYVTLNNGETMPLVGLGTSKSKPEEVEAAVKTALEIGYRHFDCAPMYRNEVKKAIVLLIISHTFTLETRGQRTKTWFRSPKYSKERSFYRFKTGQ